MTDISSLVRAARDLVSTLDLTVLESAVWRAGRRMRIGYPGAADAEAAHSEMATMIERLLARGWSGDPQFRSHGVVLIKNGVHAVLRPQNSGMRTRAIELIVHRPDD